MNSELIFQTLTGNYYFASIKKQIFIPITPLMLGIISEIGDTSESEFKVPEKIIIDGKEYLKEEIQYYLNKYKYLKSNGFFTSKINKKRTALRISSGAIQHQLANLTQLVFEVTDACNLKCKYCAYGEFYCDYDKRENSYMSFSVAKKIIDLCIENWQSPMNRSINNQINIGFYGGEPLLNIKLIKEIINYIENRRIPHISFIWNMTTNGMLLDKHMDYLVEKEFTLLISIDGNEGNHSYRVTHKGENSFQQVRRNVNLLREKFPSYFKSNVYINSVLHNRNSVNEIISYGKKEFGKIPSIGELSSTGIRPEKEGEYFRTYQNTYENLHQSENYEELESEMRWSSPDYRGLTLFIHKFSGNVFTGYSELFPSKKKKIYLPTGTCLPFDKKFFLTVNGKILPCERIGQQFYLGEVTDNDIKLDFDKIADKYNIYFDKLKNFCDNCYRGSSCIQCVFNLDTIDEKETVCKGFVGLYQFKEYLASQFSLMEKYPKYYKEIMEKIIIN